MKNNNNNWKKNKLQMNWKHHCANIHVVPNATSWNYGPIKGHCLQSTLVASRWQWATINGVGMSACVEVTDWQRQGADWRGGARARAPSASLCPCATWHVRSIISLNISTSPKTCVWGWMGERTSHQASREFRVCNSFLPKLDIDQVSSVSGESDQ